MITDNDVKECFRMGLDELNKKVNLWISNAKKYGVQVTDVSQPSDKPSMIRVYHDDYVYLLSVIRNSDGQWKVTGFCKPDGYLTKIEIEMVRLNRLLGSMSDPTSPHMLDTVSHLSQSLTHLESAHKIYGVKYCWLSA